jgi:hypothetical protein
LAIFDNKNDEHPSVFIELKRGQPEIEKIKKDFNKMMREPSSLKGACFFHLLRKSDYGSESRLRRARNNILIKYSDALEQVRLTHKFDINTLRKRWFLLFILDGSNGQYNYSTIENMSQSLGCPKDWQDIRATQ